MLSPQHEASIITFLQELGAIPPETLPLNQPFRCAEIGKPGGKDCFAIIHSDPPVSAYCKNHRQGKDGTWTDKQQTNFTPEDWAAHKKHMEATRAARQAEQARRHAEAASKAQAIYKSAVPCPSHAYLTAKGVKPVPGLKVSAQPEKYPALIVPVYDESGAIVSLQFIMPDGSKRFLSGGRKKGCFFPIGGKVSDKPLVICEGLATGLSIHQASGLPALVAFDAGNMEPVAVMARGKYSQREILIAADNDHEPMENN